MFRILVALLAALDAVVTAALGLALVLIPLSVLWLLGIGAPEWSALWPAAAAIFQLGHLVPLTITLPAEYVAVAGIDPAGASFVVSLAPLVLAAGTAVLAWRSASRAVRSGAGIVGVAAGTGVFAAAVAVVALASAGPIVSATVWQAVLLPTVVYAVPAVGGAVSAAWRHGDDGVVDRLRDRFAPGERWAAVPAAALRALATALLALLAVGALILVAGLVARGGEVIALFQVGNVDVWGALALALAQFAYLPTLLVWGVSFAAGPGFAVGIDTAVSPAATQLGVVPGIPILGAIPESTSPWLLAVVLLPLAAGALAGAVGRARLDGEDAVVPRLAVLGTVVLGSAGSAALAAALASGSIGPGRLSAVGPDPGPLALAIALEVAVGAAILLFAPGVPRGQASSPSPGTGGHFARGGPDRGFASSLPEMSSPRGPLPSGPPGEAPEPR